LFFTFGVGFLAYIIAWIVIPAARSREELFGLGGQYEPMSFNDMKTNMSQDLKDLKRRGEEMSRELRELFSRRKY
jgi:hypothetical protein